MDFFFDCVVVLGLFSHVLVHGEVTVDCGTNSMSVRWTGSQSMTEPSLLRLGNCYPSSVTVRPGGSEAIFHAEFDGCSFRRSVTENEIVFENELTSLASTEVSPVVCVYERPADWSPHLYIPVAVDSKGQGNLLFHLNIMNEDFSGVAQSTTFPLGSLIPIAADVDQAAHQPLILLLEECVASSTQTLAQDGHVHPLITNKGCLVDSKNTNSRFLPRQNLSEIRLYLQAFKFASGSEVYIHCKLVVWDPDVLDNSKKACHYDAQNGRWVLLDDPRKSALCSCCDKGCQARNQRGTGQGPHLDQNTISGSRWMGTSVDSSALARPVVLGPLTIRD